MKQEIKYDKNGNLMRKEDYVNRVTKTLQTKKPLEDIKFEYLNKLFNSFNIKENIYSFISEKFIVDQDKTTSLINDLFLKINSTKKFTKDNIESIENLYNYLSREDGLESSDLILVCGGPQKRYVKGVELYKDNLSGKILFCGNKPSYIKESLKTEAEIAKEYAIENGVKNKDIIIEKKSINTPENMVNSIKILKDKNFLPKRIILVTTNFHMLRAYLTLKSVLDWDCKIIRQVSKNNYSVNNYFKTKGGLNCFIYEYLKIYCERLMKHF